MNLAIIPARGGSKRIPGKNIKDFCGKPIIAYSILAAKQSNLFGKIIASTDSEEIAGVAKNYGAEVPFIRPSELSDDYTGTDAVVLHALEWMLRMGYDVEFVCCIYATAPFLKPELLVKGFEILERKQSVSAFSVTTFEYPIMRALKIDETGKIKMFWPEHQESRSQDFSEAYHDAGQFYWADAKRFMEEKAFFSRDAFPVIVPRYLALDIDTMEDWESAELIYRSLKTSECVGRLSSK